VQVTPGDPDDAPACGLEAAVASAVALEGLTGSVGLEAVELGDQVVLGPGEVDFEGLDDGVDARSWEGVVLEEGEEAPLELEVRVGNVNCSIEERPEPGGALAAGVAVEELGDRLRVEEAEDVCLLEGPGVWAW